MKALTDLRIVEEQAPISIAAVRAEARRFGASYLCVCVDAFASNPPSGYVLPHEVYLGWENEDSLSSMEEVLSGGGCVVIQEFL